MRVRSNSSSTDPAEMMRIVGNVSGTAVGVSIAIIILGLLIHFELVGAAPLR